jgi:hypothetical protein
MMRVSNPGAPVPGLRSSERLVKQGEIVPMSEHPAESELESDNLLDEYINEVIEELRFDRSSEGEAASIEGASLSMRDATRDVIASLGRVPPSRTDHPPSNWPPTSWNTPAVSNYYSVASPPLIGSELKFVQQSLAPDMEHRVLEVEGVDAPRLFAVSWPNLLAHTATPKGTSFIIYFRPTIAQNVKRGYYVGPGLGEYPFGWDYLFHGLWRWINYMGDPLTSNSYAKGLPYQISAARRRAVLVLPLNRYPGELGAFLNAEWMHRILLTIQRWISREAGITPVPPLGYTALAAFGSGQKLLNEFLSSDQNQRHPLYRDVIRELYMFDPPPSEMPHSVVYAMRWARSGDSADKVIRLYSQIGDESHRAVLRPEHNGPGNPPSARTRHTVVVLPNSTWRQAAQAAGAQGAINSQDAHELIAATMLTDALRRSGFDEETESHSEASVQKPVG